MKPATKKIYTCSACQKTSCKWYGQCSSCKSWNTIHESEVEKKVHFIARVSKTNSVRDKDEVESEKKELQDWFEIQRSIAIKNPFCENCGKSVIHLLESDKLFKNCHAHIFPKKTFISIRTNINNHLLLCKLCHGQYDSSWLNASKMKVWDIAIKRASTLISAITESVTRLMETNAIDFFK